MSEQSFSFKAIAVPAFGPSLLFGISTGAVLPVVALTARDLGASIAMAGFIAALIGVGSLINNIPAAMLITRIGERMAILGAAAFTMLALLMALFAPNIAVLAVGMTCFGMASSIFMLARQTYLVEAVPLHMRARALSTLGGTTRIGAFVGPFAGAALIHFYGLSGAYMVAIAAMVVAAGIAWFAPDLKTSERAADTAVPSTSVIQVARSNARVFLTLGVGILLIGAIRASRQVVIPLWAQQLGIEPAMTSVIYGLVAAIDMAVFYPAGKVMDQRGRIWVALPSTFLMGLSLICMPLTAGAVSFTIVALILGFGNGIGSGIIMTTGADASPPHQRRAFLGIWRLMSDVGASGGPLILSAVAAMASLSAAVVVIGLMGWTAAAVFWKFLPRTVSS